MLIYDYRWCNWVYSCVIDNYMMMMIIDLMFKYHGLGWNLERVSWSQLVRPSKWWTCYVVIVGLSQVMLITWRMNDEVRMWYIAMSMMVVKGW